MMDNIHEQIYSINILSSRTLENASVAKYIHNWNLKDSDDGVKHSD
jgi:hypothetical protein